MSEIVFFFLLYFLFLFCILCTIIGPYSSSYIAWFKYSQDSKDVFGTQSELKNFPMIIENHKYKSLITFAVFNLFNINTLGIFLWIWIIGNNNIYYIIPFIITFIFSYFFVYVSIKILFKKLDQIGVYSKNEAIDNFKIYQANINPDIKISEFKLYKFNRVAARNKPFQFNQWRYKGKIRRLNNKKYNEEKYNIKLLNMYIRYLKTYAVFFKAIEGNLRDFIDDYSVVINNQEYQTLEPLKDALINNFFAYVNENK